MKNLGGWGGSASKKWVLDTSMLLFFKKKVINIIWFKIVTLKKKDVKVHMLMLRFQSSKIWYDFASFLYNGFHVLLVNL